MSEPLPTALPGEAEGGPPESTRSAAAAGVTPPPQPQPQPAAAALNSALLNIYDRISHTCFRVQIEDPPFLRILDSSVVPAAEADGALPFELNEFVDYLDIYERERVRLAANAASRRHGNASSGSVGVVSSGAVHSNGYNDAVASASSAAGRAVHSDPAAVTASSAATGSGPINSSSSSTNASPHPGSGNAAVPLKLEETLRRTLKDNSDFFFRVASVAYQLDPNPCAYAAASTLMTATGSAGAGLRTNGYGGSASAPTSTPLGTGPGLVSTATGGVSTRITNTLSPSSSSAPPVRHRNYAVESGYSAAFHVCGRIFETVYHENCRALAEKLAVRFSALRLEDCVKFRKAVWTGFSLKVLEPYRSGARSESNLELRWVSEKVKDDKHLFPDRGVVPPQPQQEQQSTSSMSRIVDATLSYVAHARRRVQPSAGSSSAEATRGHSSTVVAARGGDGTSQSASAGGVTANPGMKGEDNTGSGSANASGSGAAQENELQTFGLTKLLHNPSWQKDDESSDACPSCGRSFISVSRPLGTRAHHCRSCGIRLCVLCITKRAHYSFAKLAKPGSVDESEERFVCDVCYKEYEAVSQLHYLGALFAFARLGFGDLVLCRTVNEQWREAAELCISEYRLLLHNCDADLHSVMTPVGILLQNSLFLLLGEGPTSSIFVVHHPEAALLLLKFIAAENLWVQDSSFFFISRLSNSILNRPDTILTKLPGSSASAVVDAKKRSFRLPVVPTLSHWHLFCTAFCSRISASYFFVKCAELLCTAPAKVYNTYVAKSLERMTRLYLSTTPLWIRLATANRAAEAAFHDQAKSIAAAATASHRSSSATLPTNAVARTPLPLPTLSDVAESELFTMWLLDMLHKDALVPTSRRCYQQLLERVIPTVATSSLSLVFIMLCSLRSNYAYYGYDEELFGLWRTRILAEVARADPVAKDRVSATLDFYEELDRFCAQSSLVSQTSVVDWIVRYCARGAGAASAGSGAFALPSRAGLSARRPEAYVDLPHPLLNPFRPHIVVKSIRLSGVRVAPNAATKPIWLAFSTWTKAEHHAYAQRLYDDATAAASVATTETTATETSPPSAAVASPKAGAPPVGAPPPATSVPAAALSTPAPAQECLFLYKRENVERDQLMCMSSRLLQMLLASEIGGAEMLDYSVLPLSCDSGLIEKAEARELSSLDNMDITSFVLHRGQEGCANFLASARLFLLLNYIFSIGDRHKGNVLIGANGALLHIDFRFIFSEKTFVEKLARTTVRIDDAFLAAVEQCQQRQYPAAAAAAAAAARSTGKNPPAPASSFFSRAPASPTKSPPTGGASATGSTNAGSATTSPTADTPPSPAELRAAFFASAAEWFVHVRPFAAVFYELWLYAVHRHTVPYNEKELLMMLNTLFDRHASQGSSASKFSTTMKESVNVCRLKDVTHSSAEVLRTFADQVSRRMSESGADAVKMVGNMWSSWWSRGS